MRVTVIIALVFGWLSLFSYNHAYADTYNIDIVKANKLCNKVCKDKKTDMSKVTREILKHRGKLDPNIVLAIAIVESNLYSRARDGRSQSVGFMQVNVKYHRSKFRSRDYYDMSDNIRVGSSILNDCAKKHRYDHKRTVYCYNGGTVPNYLKKVNKNMYHGVFTKVKG